MLSNSTTSKVVSMSTKPLLNASVVYLGSKILGISGSMDNPIFGQMDSSAQLALGAAISSLGTQVAHSWVLPELGDGNFYSGASNIFSVGIQAGLFTIYCLSTDGGKANQIGGLELAGLGAAAEIGASYANDAVVRPWLGL